MKVRHYTKYKDIDGVDEFIFMEQSEHMALHHRLRREGKCNIPVEKLRKISYRTNDRVITKNNRKDISFSENLGKYVELDEQLSYRLSNGNVVWCSWFRGSHGHKLVVIDEQ